MPDLNVNVKPLSFITLAACTLMHMHPGAFMVRLMKEWTFHPGASLIPAWWNWQDRLTALKQGPCSSGEEKHQAGSLLHHVCLTPFSQWWQWFSILKAWNARVSGCVCVSERSVCPQKRACFHLQVNINNTFCHQGMFVKAKGHHSTGRGRRATFHNLPLLAPKMPPYCHPLNLYLLLWMWILAR